MQESYPLVKIHHEIIREPALVYSHPFSFDDLGISKEFRLLNREGDISYGTPIHLIGLSSASENFYICPVEIDSTYFDGSKHRETSLIMYSTAQDGRFRAVGHVDFTGICGSEETECFMSVLDSLSFDTAKDSLPEPIQNSIRYWMKSNEAVIVDDSYRNNHFGALLWALGCGYMEMRDVRALTIRASSNAKSFYKRYTAQEDHKGKKMYTLTHLTSEQEFLVGHAIGLFSVRG